MSNYLSQNMKFLRKERSLTQDDLAQKLSINRPSIGAYEEGRAEPKLQTLQNMAHYFNISIDELLNVNLAQKGKRQTDIKGKTLRILPVPVNSDGRERITVVPVKAAAGYLTGYRDVEFIESLPTFDLPLKELGERTYRLFQINGDSMLPVPSGSYIIAEYLQDWNNIKDNQCYVLVSRDEGIVYKRVVNKLDMNELILKSDNTEYKPYSIMADTLAEVWKAVGYISLDLPDGSSPVTPAGLADALNRLQLELGDIKSQLSGR